MATYKNCYRLVREVRLGINEFDEALASGEDNVGAYSNEWLIDRINDSIAQLFALIIRRNPDELTRERSITGVNSVFALPSDFGRLVLFRDNYGQKVYPITHRERRLTDDAGRLRLYYQKGRSLYLDREGISDTYSLIYKPKPRKIHMGRCSADTTDGITLDAKMRSFTDDYYTGMIVENESSAWEGEITAYVSGEATVAGNDSVAGDLYGLVPEIPEWAHFLIGPQAVIMAKQHPIAKERATQREIDSFNEMLRSALAEFGGLGSDDMEIDEMLSRFEPNAGGVLFF